MERSRRLGPFGVPEPIPGLSSAGRGNSNPGGKEKAMNSFLISWSIHQQRQCGNRPPIGNGISASQYSPPVVLNNAQERAPVKRIQVAAKIQAHPERRLDVAGQIEVPRVCRSDERK